METEEIGGWEPVRKSLKPPADAPTMRTAKQSAPTKPKFKRITETDAASWWSTAFEVVGEFSGYPQVWELDKEEAKKLGKPSATAYNEMPEKLRKLLGIENLQQGAFILACLQIGWYLRKTAVPRFVGMRMMQTETVDTDDMTDAQFGQTIAKMFGNDG